MHTSLKYADVQRITTISYHKLLHPSAYTPQPFPLFICIPSFNHISKNLVTYTHTHTHTHRYWNHCTPTFFLPQTSICPTPPQPTILFFLAVLSIRINCVHHDRSIEALTHYHNSSHSIPAAGIMFTTSSVKECCFGKRCHGTRGYQKRCKLCS